MSDSILKGKRKISKKKAIAEQTASGSKKKSKISGLSVTDAPPKQKSNYTTAANSDNEENETYPNMDFNRNNYGNDNDQLFNFNSLENNDPNATYFDENNNQQDNQAAKNEKEEEEEEEESIPDYVKTGEEEKAMIKARLSIDKERNRSLINSMSEEQTSRYEAFKRSALPKAHIRKVRKKRIKAHYWCNVYV